MIYYSVACYRLCIIYDSYLVKSLFKFHIGYFLVYEGIISFVK